LFNTDTILAYRLIKAIRLQTSVKLNLTRQNSDTKLTGHHACILSSKINSK